MPRQRPRNKNLCCQSLGANIAITHNSIMGNRLFIGAAVPNFRQHPMKYEWILSQANRYKERAF
jgi:hypothetical protein